jgi:hypothetical protein
MGFNRYEQGNASAPAVFTYGGTWDNLAFTDQTASGGSFAYTYTAGATCTITVAGGNSKTGMLLLARYTFVGNSTSTATVTLDGVPVGTWDQTNKTTTQNAEYWWPQSCFQPISWFATDPFGVSTHTVVITCTTGQLCIDAIDLFDTAVGMNPGTINGFGHSIMYGYNPLTFGQYATPFISEVARRLVYSPANNGVPAEDLTNGRNGFFGPSSALNSVLYSNSAVATPGWVRARGAAWAARQDEIGVILHGRNDTGYTSIYDFPPSQQQFNMASAWLGSQALYSTAAVGGSGTYKLAWNGNTTAAIASTSAAAAITSALAAATPSPIPYVCQDFLTAGGFNSTTAIKFLFSTNGSVGAGSVTLTAVTGMSGGTMGIIAQPANNGQNLQNQYIINNATAIGNVVLTWNGISTAPIDTAISGGPQVTSALATAGIPYTCTVITTASFNTGIGIWMLTGNVPGSQPSMISFSGATSLAVGGGTLFISNATNATSPGYPALTNYALNRFKQRYRELLWYRQMNCVPGLTFCVGQDYLSTDTATSIAQLYNAAIQAVCNEPTVKHAFYVDTLGVSRSIPNYVNTDTVHPSQEGHYRLADTVLRAILTNRTPQITKAWH